MLRSNYRFLHVLRAALKLASLVAFFAAFASAPLADVTAIAFTAPIFVTVGAWILLGGAAAARAHPRGRDGLCRRRCWCCARGSRTGSPTGLAMALLGAALTAVIQLILKPMSARDSTETLVAWNLIAMVPIAAVPALLLLGGRPRRGNGRCWRCRGCSARSTWALVTRAFSLAEASLIVPIDFLRLPFVAALGFLMFGQTVPPTTWIGGAVIFGATLLMARSARSRRRAP